MSQRFHMPDDDSELMDRPRFVQTFGAALWIVDYVLQGALNGVDRLYFHQGTISNCVSASVVPREPIG